MEEMKYLELYLDRCAHQVSPNCRHCPKGETRVPTLELSTTSCAVRALSSFSLIGTVRGGLDYPSFSWKIEASREEITCPMLPARSRTWLSANPEPRLDRPIPILKTRTKCSPLRFLWRPLVPVRLSFARTNGDRLVSYSLDIAHLRDGSLDANNRPQEIVCPVVAGGVGGRWGRGRCQNVNRRHL